MVDSHEEGVPLLLRQKNNIFHESFDQRISVSEGYSSPDTTGTKGRQYHISFSEDVDKITLTWNNLSAYVPPPDAKCWRRRQDTVGHKEILSNVSGVAHPGTLLAIVGASGAGKTTLLNILTYRNRGNLVIDGDVRVNGGTIGRGMASLSGYVQQEDLFIGTLKVKEQLWFQAMLRMDKSVPYSVRKHRVEQVMNEMGLTKCANTTIGIPGKVKGISGGEKKRLAFACEVLTNPSLMFCDEPTSGLDSFMAQQIVKVLRDMAAKGRTILCTIHQPSSEVFELFDRVLVMAEGSVAYLGPSSDALNFFKVVGFPCPVNYNPADYYVQTLAIVPGKEDKCRRKVKKICDAYRHSVYFDDVRDALSVQQLDIPNGGLIHPHEMVFADRSSYKASWCRQFQAVFWRSWLSNTREPQVIRDRIIQAISLGIIFGLVYLNQELNQKGVTNINGSLFLIQTQMTFGFVFSTIMTFPAEFPIFIREHHDGMYRVDVYYLCKTLAEFPQFVAIPVVFVIIMYFMVGLYMSVDAFFICLLVSFLVCNVSVSFGYVMSSSTDRVNSILAIAPIVIVPIMMIGGFYVNSASVPLFMSWLQFLSWFTYANEILVINQWQHVTNITCESDAIVNATQNAGSRCFRSGQEIIDSFSYDAKNIPFDFVMLFVLMVIFRLLSFLLLLIRARKKYN